MFDRKDKDRSLPAGVTELGSDLVYDEDEYEEYFMDDDTGAVPEDYQSEAGTEPEESADAVQDFDEESYDIFEETLGVDDLLDALPRESFAHKMGYTHSSKNTAPSLEDLIAAEIKAEDKAAWEEEAAKAKIDELMLQAEEEKAAEQEEEKYQTLGDVLDAAFDEVLNPGSVELEETPVPEDILYEEVPAFEEEVVSEEAPAFEEEEVVSEEAPVFEEEEVVSEEAPVFEEKTVAPAPKAAPMREISIEQVFEETLEEEEIPSSMEEDVQIAAPEEEVASEEAAASEEETPVSEEEPEEEEVLDPMERLRRLIQGELSPSSKKKKKGASKQKALFTEVKKADPLANVLTLDELLAEVDKKNAPEEEEAPAPAEEASAKEAPAPAEEAPAKEAPVAAAKEAVEAVDASVKEAAASEEEVVEAKAEPFVPVKIDLDSDEKLTPEQLSALIADVESDHQGEREERRKRQEEIKEFQKQEATVAARAKRAAKARKAEPAPEEVEETTEEVTQAEAPVEKEEQPTEKPRTTSAKKRSGKKRSGKKQNPYVKAGRKFLTAARVKKSRNANGKIRMLNLSEGGLLLLFPAVFLYYELLLRLVTKTGLFTHVINLAVFTIAAGLFAEVFVSCFSEKVNEIVTTAILAVSGIMFIVMAMVKNAFQVYMTFRAILNGASGVTGEYSSNLAVTIIGGIPLIVLYLLPTIAFAYFALIKKKVRAYQYKLPMGVLLFIVSLVFFLAGCGMAHVGSSKPLYTESYEYDTAIENFGLITGQRLNLLHAGASGGFKVDKNSQEEEGETEYPENKMDLKLEEKNQEETDEDLKELNEYVMSLTASKQNEYTGIFKGKNLIMICLEAFSDAVVDPDLTPTLYRMQHNGFNFSNYYQPTWGGSTSSGEYSFLTGIAPLEGIDTIQETKGHNMYFTIGNSLQREGYYSMAFHNGTAEYYQRTETHPNLGYTLFYATHNGLENIAGRYPTDTVMVDTTLDTYIDKQPFSIYYMTVSGHAGYEADSPYVEKYLDIVKEKTGGKYCKKVNYYLCYQYEVEKMVENLIARLEKAGIADNTVICMTADHYPYGLAESTTFNNPENYVDDLYGYDFDVCWERDHNSWFLWSESLEEGHELAEYAKEISAPTFSLDIVPTLSNLFGIEYDSRLFAGRDVFSDEEPIIFWKNHTWITEKGKYDASESTFYPEDENEEVDEEYVKRITDIVYNRVNFSGAVLKNDYYTYLFGKDQVTDNTLWEEMYKDKDMNQIDDGVDAIPEDDNDQI